MLLLPGEPGLTLDPSSGAPIFHLDVSSPRYATAFGRLLAELHAIEAASAPGIEVETPAQVRARWRTDIAAVRAEFEVADHLVQRWSAWLDDDDCWRQLSAPPA